MTEIEIRRARENDQGFAFRVTLTDSGSESVHDVRLSHEDYVRLGSEPDSPEQFVERCFRFLLEREPKELVLSRFDIRVIGRYFPEFEEAIRRREEH